MTKRSTLAHATLALAIAGCGGNGNNLTAEDAGSGAKAANQPEEHGSAGAESGTGGATSDPVCPPGSPNLSLDLSGASLEPVPGVTNHFEGFGNIEGPVWLGGALYYSNISGGANPPPSVVWKLVPGGTPTVVVPDAGSNGLAVNSAGDLVLAMHSNGTVSARSVTNLLATPTPLIETHEGARFNSPNDLVFHSDGTLYFTDPTWQAPDPVPQAESRAYRVRDGVATAIGVVDKPENPNGITLSVDETALFIGGVNGLYRYTLASDGSVETPGSLVTTADLGSGSGIDGLGRDCAGNIYVTVHSDRKVVVLSPAGEQIGALDVPSAGGVTNVAFGGADRQTLYVTSLGETPQIHSVRLNVPGYPY